MFIDLARRGLLIAYNYSSTIFLKSPHIGAAQYLVAQPLGTYKVALKLANGDELPTVGGFSPSI